MTIPLFIARLPPARRGQLRRAAALLFSTVLAAATATIPASDIPPHPTVEEVWGEVHWYPKEASPQSGDASDE